jgi:classical protein kinase C/novel protein kinase C epsilon type
MRKPLTGLLTLRIHAVKDVDHAASSRFSRGPETFVVVKVEDAIKARTKATRTDKWQDEAFNIEIDKANEIELTVYDRSGDRPNPIGMLWVRISDIAEEMRRKKIESEFNASGWVSADKMEHGGAHGRQDAGGAPGSSNRPPSGGHPGGPGQGYAGGAPGGPSAGPVLIDSWFALEPVGRIHLTLSFGEYLYTTFFTTSVH